MFLKNKSKTQKELYFKLAEVASELEQGEKCANAEKFLKELMKK